MIVYHEVDLSDLASILREGIKRTSRGEEGDEENIIRTDKFLDEHRPEHLLEAGVSRDDNIYAYYSNGSVVVDITDGDELKIDEFVKNSDSMVVRLDIDPSRCYVSDLDEYDRVKGLVELSRPEHLDPDNAIRYWAQLCSLKDYKLGRIRRPEVMVTYDIEPESVAIAEPDSSD